MQFSCDQSCRKVRQGHGALKAHVSWGQWDSRVRHRGLGQLWKEGENSGVSSWVPSWSASPLCRVAQGNRERQSTTREKSLTRWENANRGSWHSSEANWYSAIRTQELKRWAVIIEEGGQKGRASWGTPVWSWREPQRKSNHHDYTLASRVPSSSLPRTLKCKHCYWLHFTDGKNWGVRRWASCAARNESPAVWL